MYDAEYGWSRIDEFFLAVTNETPRVRILDLGCGTGRLAVALAAAGHQVTGLDPAAASLAAARAKPNADATPGSREPPPHCATAGSISPS